MNTAPVCDISADTDALLESMASSSPSHRAFLEEELVRRHLGLARRLAARFAGRGAEREDLVQVANFALFKALRGFNHDKGEFVPFATVTILGEIKKYFRDQCWGIRPPRRIQQLQADISKATERRLHKDAHTPGVLELAADLGTDVVEIREALSARGCFSPSSLDQPSRDGAQPLADTLADEDSPLDFIEDWVTLGPLCRELADDERELLRLRFVEDKTQQEIAAIIGVSQMQVSRRLSRLLDLLRSQLFPAVA